MKKFYLASALCFCIPAIFAQSIADSWAGELQVQGLKIPLVFNIKQKGDSYSSTMDSPSQGAKDLPVDKTTFTDKTLVLEASSFGIAYKGALENDKISGNFTQGGMSIPLVLSRKKTAESELKRPQEPKAPFNYDIDNITFINPKDKNTLAGTLTLPRDKKEFPIAILITGSGTQNRDEEIFGHKPFWVIADDFAKKGIGVLRLDDRGIGDSSKGSKDDTSENYATDIESAVNFLSKKGYKNIGLIGHSEGGMIAPMVASQNKNVKFIVSMAGVGIPADELLIHQNEALAKLSGATEEEIISINATNKRIYSFIKNYKGSDINTDAKKLLLEEINHSVKGQLPPEDKINEQIEIQVKQITNPWFVYLLKFNPDTHWSKIKIPVLAINGTKDMQVLADENLAGIKKSLEKAGNKKVQIQSFEGLNHMFQTAKSGAVEEYYTIEESISPKVLDVMSNWILKN